LTGRFSEETRPVEIGDEIRAIDKRSKDQPPIVKRVTGVLKGPGGGVRTVLYVLNDGAVALRCTGWTWRNWQRIAAEEAPAAAGKPGVGVPGAGVSGRRASHFLVDELQAPPAFTETRDVLTKPVQRRCRRCPRVFETKVMTQWDCPGCTEQARAAEQAKNGAAE